MSGIKKYLFLLLILISTFAVAQEKKDSLGFFIESKAAIGSKDYLPFWILNNQEGRFTDRRADLWLEGGANGWYKIDSNFTLKYQLEAVAKSPLKNSFIKQYNTSISWKSIQFIGGRFYNEDTDIASNLRSGSFIQSNNAIPVPRIGFAVNNFTPVPFTKNYLQFKGSWYHGWFEEERAISNAWLHEKSAYLRLGKSNGFGLSWGLVHEAIWGGTDKFGTKWTRGFGKDYYRVVTGSAAANEQNLDTNVRLEGSNRQGNHLGIWDIRLNYTYKQNKVEVYYQRLWEDGWSVNHIFNEDAKFGFAWKKSKSESALINAVVVEFIHTILQRSPGLPDSVPGQSNYGLSYGGRDDYYNNWLYRSGWTYQGRVIGNPLFITDDRAENYFGSIDNYRVKIVNNRFWAIHLGIESKPSKNLKVNAKFTFSRNYGTYAGINGGRFKWGSKDPDFDNSNYPFIKPLNQLNSIIETTYSPPSLPNLYVNFGFAADVGEMTENYGGFLGIKWNFPNRHLGLNQ